LSERQVSPPLTPQFAIVIKFRLCMNSWLNLWSGRVLRIHSDLSLDASWSDWNQAEFFAEFKSENYFRSLFGDVEFTFRLLVVTRDVCVQRPIFWRLVPETLRKTALLFLPSLRQMEV
jgi:hypothetical protein